MSDRVTGKAGAFKLATISLPYTKWSAKITRKLAPSTDSGDYDTTSDLIHETQEAVSLQHEFTVEGRYRLSKTMTNAITPLYTSSSPVAAIFDIDASTHYGHGNVDISDFETSTPVDDTVTWTCTAKSNGIFVVGS